MTKYARNIKYNHEKEAEFQNTLKRRVDEHFKPLDGHRKANGLMWFKIALFFVGFWANWYALAFHAHSLPVSIALIVSQALLFKTIAYNVAHDAVHRAITGNSKIDDAIFWISFNMLGPNAYLWKIRHNNAHHFFVNIPGCDIDIEGTKAIRFAPHVEWKPMHRYQHLYATFAYMIFTLHWIFIKDFMIYRMKEFGNVTNLNHSPWRFVEMVTLKLVYVGYMIAVPALVLPYSLGTIIAAFIGFHLFLSLYVTLSFVSSHIGIHSQFVDHDENGRLPHSFIEHQLLTSIDFHPTNSVVGFFYGGFNSHVAHHMFPQISSIHYVPISKIIQETTAEYGLPYYQMSIPRLFLSHYQFLKKLGAGPESGQEHYMRPPQKRAS